jgi:plastocyanin
VDNNFPDGTFTIHVGDTVTWTHKGTAPHSVSADAFDSNPNCSSATSAIPGNCLKGGDTFSHKFDAAGTFAYHCRVHGSMTGTITVVA